ncbi:hypothetical protein Leryth_006752 [Lithospermum erythrorhizon]|nr:hypothetical protein Leryth_006752 [Lithospermum erythrorhizon]
MYVKYVSCYPVLLQTLTEGFAMIFSMDKVLFFCACGSPNRQELYRKVGHFQVPYLNDPNTGVQMFRRRLWSTYSQLILSEKLNVPLLSMSLYKLALYTWQF